MLRYAATAPALGMLEAAFDAMRQTGERYWEAEIHRLRGEFLLNGSGAGREQAVEASFLRALDVARGQGGARSNSASPPRFRACGRARRPTEGA